MTGHSFSAELQGERDSFQVSFTPTPIPARERRCLPGGQWAEPDLDEAAKAMRLVVQHPELAMARARSAQERARRQFSPKRAARTMKDRLAAIDRLRHGDGPSRVGRPAARVATTG